MTALRRGISYQLRQDLVAVRDEPTGMAEWVTLCLELEGRRKDAQPRADPRAWGNLNARPAATTSAAASAPPNHTAVSGTHAGPMNLSAGSGRTPKLTPEKRDRCIAEGRCLRCRRTGHFAKNSVGFTRSPLRAFEAALDSESSSAYASASSSPPPVSVRPAAPVEQLKE
jgi:hypothetical protein